MDVTYRLLCLRGCCSILGRIVKVGPEVLSYREWIIKKWGAKQCAKLENNGEPVFHFYLLPVCFFCLFLFGCFYVIVSWHCCCAAQVVGSWWACLNCMILCGFIRRGDLWAGACQNDADWGPKGFPLSPELGLPFTFSSVSSQPSTPFFVFVSMLAFVFFLWKRHCKTTVSICCFYSKKLKVSTTITA